MKDAIFTYLSDKSPIFGAIIVASIVVWWAAKFYYRMRKTENEVKAVQTDIAAVKTELKAEITEVRTELKAEIANVKTELKAEIACEITKLKENDLFHLGKALLIGFSESLKNNPERFERMKDVILESTPDKKKDEIKYITL